MLEVVGALRKARGFGWQLVEGYNACYFFEFAREHEKLSVSASAINRLFRAMSLS
jgi:hypothetical protein